MKHAIIGFVSATLLSFATLCGATAQPNDGKWWGPGMKGGWTTGGWARHHYAMMGGVPEPYRSTKNPLLKTEATFSRGAAIYHQNCASCHGDSGHGDGPAGLLLSPPPADLAWLAAMPMSQWDSYMNWTVSEGGVPFGTAMPAFKGALSREEIWAVIGYVQNQLPNDVSSGQPYGPPTRRWRCCYRW